MEKKRKIWTLKKLKDAASKFKTKQAFRSGDPAAYEAAKYHKVINDICGHMEGGKKPTLSNNQIKIAALKCKTRKEFKNLYSGEYQAAVRLNLIDEICSHMEPGKHFYTFERLLKAAMSCLTRTEFKNKFMPEYTYLVKHGLLDEFCSHMEQVKNGYDKTKPGSFYFYRIELNGKTVYKIGITNRAIKTRVREVVTSAKSLGYKIKTEMEFTFSYKDGSIAYDVEKTLIQIFKNYKEPIIPHIEGRSEMYSSEVGEELKDLIKLFIQLLT